MNKVGTILYTMLNGKLVGEDEFGNKYYQRNHFSAQIGRRNTKRRWVLYKGSVEPTKIPAYWHGWVHHSTDIVPTTEDVKKHNKWQKGHLPNMTGTDSSYKQDGLHGKRVAVSSDYQAWKP